MATKKTKVSIVNDEIVADENGSLTLPVESNLWHRFEIVDGAIVDKYNGVSDDEVRRIDHAEATARTEAAIAEWDAAEEKIGPRPLPLPPLDI